MSGAAAEGGLDPDASVTFDGYGFDKCIALNRCTVSVIFTERAYIRIRVCV